MAMMAIRKLNRKEVIGYYEDWILIMDHNEWFNN
jgi:hypothetical protein